MAVSSNELIKASQFNNLQNRISQVLGTGSGNFGYGQSVASSQVSSLQDPSIPDGNSVLASQFNNLRSDLAAAYTHQTGNSFPVSSFTAGDIIGADSSGTDLDRNGDTFVFVNEETNKGFNDLLNIMTDLETNRFDIATSQQDLQVKIIDDKLRQWNGTIVSEFTVNWSDASSRRYYFNAGGEIRIEGTVDLSTSTGDSYDRDQGWNDLLENPGQIQFDYNSTQITGSTSGVTYPNGVIGNDSVTGSFQTIFRKDASGGVYGNSYWLVEAREDNSSRLRFRITLVDAGPESNPDQGDTGSIPGGVEEPVTADLEFEYSMLRANGSVVVSAPGFNLSNSFE